jgi:hypothetical protein
MCPIPNGFRDRTISLYSSKIVDKKEILHTGFNTRTDCSSDKIGTVHIFENSTVSINALCNSCEDMPYCSSKCILTFGTVKYIQWAPYKNITLDHIGRKNEDVGKELKI